MPQIGEVLANKYRLDKVAGEGGMGIVYAAEHLVLKQRVAVKVLLPHAVSSEASVERFAREARAAAKIDSEHVARVIDAGVLATGAPFLVMEFLEGCDLEELLALQKTLSVTEVADALIEALEGLAHAHAAQVIHRDLKPANLFLACRPDGTNAIKVLDFGISKTPRTRPEDKRLTGQHVLGSPVYMSPEQLRNATDIDARADLWSLGVVAYELLTGLPPFDGEGVGEIFANILEKVPLPLSRRASNIPEDFSQVIAKCLRRDPNERWRDAAELARALLPWASEGHAADVERAEQILARSRQLRVQKTPLETRRVVEAIEAAALRASVSPRPSSSDALPLARLKKTGAVTLEDTLRVRAFAFAKRSPLRTAAIAAMLSVMVGVGIFGVSRATRASTSIASAAPTPPMQLAKLEPPPAAPTAAPAPEPPPPAPAASPPVARPRAAKPANGKPGARPKFLTTRE